MTATLTDRARALLHANDRGDFTVPSPRLYPHQWAWDSAFAAIGWSHIDPARGLAELVRLFAGQWPDGRVPHIQFAEGVTDYFPGPELWSCARTSTITNPPVWSEALVRLLAAGADAAGIRALLPAVERSHAFFHAARDPLDLGAVAVAHPWESGLDNSPAWDPALAAIDPALAPPFQRVDKQKVADPAMRPSDDHYKRYVVIVRAIAESDFGVGPFLVYDPFMTTMLARAEGHLVELARALGVPTDAAGRRDRLLRGLAGLWEPALGRYVYKDALTGAPITPDVLPAYAPLLLPDLAPSTRRVLLDGLHARYLDVAHPLPTTAPSDPAFDPRLYWRGPTWINMNWLFAQVPELAGLGARTIALVEQSGFWEYFHPETGAGLGTDEFTWSAALVLDLAA